MQNIQKNKYLAPPEIGALGYCPFKLFLKSHPEDARRCDNSIPLTVRSRAACLPGVAAHCQSAGLVKAPILFSYLQKTFQVTYRQLWHRN